jgi:hypothetical protein
MRASLGVTSCVLVASAIVACSGNAPLSSSLVNMAGGAGTAGASNSGGTTGTAGVYAPASSAAGAAGTAAAGTGGADAAGTGGADAPGTGGFSAGAGGSSAAGAAGTTAVGAGGAGGAVMLICGSATRPDLTCVPGAYQRNGVCTCQQGAPCVCPGVGCIDPMADDDNCGACGFKCGATSTCQSGVCGPPVVNVVPARAGCDRLDLAYSGGTLYWTDKGHGLVQSIRVATNEMATLVSSEAQASHLAIAAGSLFWLDQGSNTIRAMPITSMTPTTVYADPNPLPGIAGFTPTPDGTAVYFSDGTDVLRVSRGGGAPLLIAREVHGGLPGALALSGTQIGFPTALNGDVDVVTIVPGQVASCGGLDADGNLIQLNCTRLARSQGELFTDAILAPPGLFVWADGSNIKMEAATPGQLSPMVFDTVTMTDQEIGGLALTAKAIYFGDDDPTHPGQGVIYKAAIGKDQPALRLGRGQVQPRSFVVGDTKVYWSTPSCSIESTSL